MSDALCDCGHAASCHGPEGCEVEVRDYGVLDCTCTRTFPAPAVSADTPEPWRCRCGRQAHNVPAGCPCQDAAAVSADTRLIEALELIRDGRCSCGYRFKWTGMQMRCENCGTHCGSVPPYIPEIARNALASVRGGEPA